MNTLQQVFTLGFAAQLVLLCCCLGVLGDEVENSASLMTDRTESHGEGLRHKRAPGWGKRSGGLDTFDGDDSVALLDSDDVEDVSEEEKRAPGWGKRDNDMDKRPPGWGKRAPGWGKRAPGWGKRAPGWGKRAPGWGKRAPGWGKRAPGWGKRALDIETEEKRAPGWGKRAPGWGKRAPGWGKRAPGWGKRAPGWGKRSQGEETNTCQVLSEEVDFHVSKAIELGITKTCCSNRATVRQRHSYKRCAGVNQMSTNQLYGSEQQMRGSGGNVENVDSQLQ